MPTRRDRIEALLQALNRDLFEKEQLMALTLLSAMAGESIFLLGPPGVAKSMIARRLKYAFTGAKSFEYLMGKFSTPDEVFGPVSISRLKDEDKYERLTENYLPGANIVFLDEIWKASPPIQNSLLTVLNEKIYRNGEQEIKVNIRGLVAASNELPLTGEGLEALWDRFLIRRLVINVQTERAFNQLLQLPGDPDYHDIVEEPVKISEEEYHQWAAGIERVDLPRHLFGLFNQLRRRIRQRNLEANSQMYVSDRRWRKLAHLLRSSAFLHERTEVHLIDAFLISDCIWNDDAQIEEAAELVADTIRQHGFWDLVAWKQLREELDDLRGEVEAATQIERREQVPVVKRYSDGKENYFVCLKGFWSGNHGYLAERDWKALLAGETGQIQHLRVWERAGEKKFTPFNATEVKQVGAFAIEAKGKHAEVETELEEKVWTETKPPEPATRRIWDSQISMMLQACEAAHDALEKRGELEFASLENHLFVPAAQAKWVRESLENTIEELARLKLEIQKTQHRYDSL